jgi:integrase
MSPPRQSLSEYLRIRRGLGYQLNEDERVLSRYVDHLDLQGEELVTVRNALEWAGLHGDGNRNRCARRLAPVRGFARYLHALDPAHELLPADLLPRTPQRAVPYLYSAREIAALLAASSSLSPPLCAASYRTLIGLLAVTGMRIGEALALDVSDIDWQLAVVTIREGKFSKMRALPLHHSTMTALEEYLRVREAHPVAGGCAALFVSARGTRMLVGSVEGMWRSLVKRAGLKPRSARCRPRIHDLRHSFAVATLLDWYRTDIEVQPKLPLLSTYLGHVHPRHSYWYLEAAPELMALAADRLERSRGGPR